MNRIIAGMYGTFAEPKQGLFGLQSGRIVMSKTEACHELQWYNVYGEKVGEGSLAVSDLAHIADGLLDTELFIILDAPADIRILPMMGLIALPVGVHGIPTLTTDGLESFARCIVAHGAIHVPRNNQPLVGLLHAQGVACEQSSRSALRHLIADAREKNALEN